MVDGSVMAYRVVYLRCRREWIEAIWAQTKEYQVDQQGLLEEQFSVMRCQFDQIGAGIAVDRDLAIVLTGRVELRVRSIEGRGGKISVVLEGVAGGHNGR